MGKRKSRKRSHQQFAEDYTEGVNVYDDSSYVDETSIARSLDQSIHHYEHTSQMPAQIRRLVANFIFSFSSSTRDFFERCVRSILPFSQ